MITNKKRKSFTQWFISFFVLAFLGFVSITNMQVMINAADVSGINVNGLTATYDKGTWTGSGSSIDGSVTATSSCNNYTAQTGTLTLKNSKSMAATLSFNYKLTVGGGSAKIDSTTYSSNTTSTFSKELAANATITIALTSAKSATPITIAISNISLISDTTVHTTFNPTTNGSYTVSISDGTGPTTITTQTTYYRSSTLTYTVTATPSSGYKFAQWKLNNSNFSTQNPCTFSQDIEGAVITCVFVLSNAATFSVDGSYYYDLNEANTAAVSSSSKKIILIENGTITQGTYSISSGVTLLIPFNASYTTYTDQPDPVDSTANPSAYRTLSISYGVVINVSGNISLSAQVYQGDGRTVGPYGAIKFLNLSSGQQESVINLKNGSRLYCWGYIWGNSGQVIAESGSIVYEPFQLAGWRGGNATSGMLNNSQKVFPVNQYFVQNIEVLLKINYGAQEKLFTATTMSVVGTSKIPVDFIGTSSGLFRLSSGSYVTKRFDPATEMLVVQTFGTVTISSISMTVKVSFTSQTINSNSYVLPISSSMDITILNSNNSNNPSKIITSQDLAILPGVKLTIEENAEFSIQNQNSVYVYDYDEWKGKAYGHTNSGYPMINTNDACRVKYSPSSRTARTTLSDAEIDINGTVNVASQAGLYTTTGGAHIHSSGKSGSIVFSDGPGNKTSTYQAVQSGTDISYDTISITNAKLHNGTAWYGGGDEYYLTDDVEPGFNVVYDAKNDKWGAQQQQSETISVEFRDNYNAGNSFTKTYEYPDESFVFPTQSEAGFVDANGYKLRKWVNAQNEVYGPLDVFEGKIEDGTIFYAYYGGWLTDKNLITSYTYKTTSDAPSYPEGIATVEKLNDESNTETYLFLANGILSTETKVVFNSSDSNYYYFETGVLGRNAGLLYLDTDGDYYPDSYYYIDENGMAYKSRVEYIGSGLNGLLDPGFYEFGSDAKMIVPGNPDHITNDVVKDSLNNTVRGYGLFHLTISNTTHLYYCREDGMIVKNVTFYVTKVNNYSVNGEAVAEGLYYFDNNGYMYYGNGMLIDGVEFGVIVDTTGTIITGGAY